MLLIIPAHLAIRPNGIIEEIAMNENNKPMEERPITPHASPIIDIDGNITYIGEDGRRYVVGLPPEADETSVNRVMGLLRKGSILFPDIEKLCHRWIETVKDAELDSRAAMVLLLTTLETVLEDSIADPE